MNGRSRYELGNVDLTILTSQSSFLLTSFTQVACYPINITPNTAHVVVRGISRILVLVVFCKEVADSGEPTSTMQRKEVPFTRAKKAVLVNLVYQIMTSLPTVLDYVAVAACLR